MAASTTRLEKLQAEVKKLRSENTRLKRQLRRFTGPGKKGTRTRKQRLATIRQAAQRNAMTETEAMALALEAEHAPND